LSIVYPDVFINYNILFIYFEFPFLLNKKDIKIKENNKLMLITCNLMGGLGNQLFQIMTLITLAEKEKIEYVFLRTEYLQSNNNETRRETYWDSMFKELSEKTKERIYFINKEYIIEKGFRYQELKLEKTTNDKILYGHFQSYKYFEKGFVLKKLNIIEKRNKILKKWEKGPTYDKTAIHFRFGDYKKLTKIYTLLDVNYYIQCINKITNTKIFYYFYDKQDKEDVESIIIILKSIYKNYEFNDGTSNLKDWEECLLMSCFKNNIIANSTFSWWSGYLNTNIGHKVYYPIKWFVDKTKDCSDLFLPEWIGIKN